MTSIMTTMNRRQRILLEFLLYGYAAHCWRYLPHRRGRQNRKSFDRGLRRQPWLLKFLQFGDTPLTQRPARSPRMPVMFGVSGWSRLNPTGPRCRLISHSHQFSIKGEQ
jgi:hypothetical protein